MVAVAAVAVYLTSLYSLYAPSFGNDAWRDTIWASQVFQTCRITETAVRRSAYPLLMVPLEYRLTSLLSGVDPAWFSVVIGLLYLV
jgi:hypothetical protein